MVSVYAYEYAYIYLYLYTFIHKFDRPSRSGWYNARRSWLQVVPQWRKLELISRCRYTVAVGPNIITKEELTESDSVLVYIPIIDYRAHNLYAHKFEAV